MEKIKEIVADLMECYDGTGTPNQHYIKNKVAELHNIVKNINYDTVLATVVEKKWKEYRLQTNNEDAWLFKQWLLTQL